MPTLNIIQAVNDALRIQMRQDPRVVILGEDVGRFGGVFRATAGLFEEFGADRVIDTPLAEGGIIGTAIGMAMNGLRPVPEIQFSDFIYPAFDQIVNELAKLRYRSGGQYSAPLVIRTPSGGGIKGGHYHSQSPEAYFIHTPGLKVVMPSNPYDAKGLLLSALRGEDPVVFFEPKRIYRASRGEVPEEDYTIPLGQAQLVYPEEPSGEAAATVVSWGAMVPEAIEAARAVAAEGIAVEVLDLRTLWPLDLDAIVQSVRRTGRAVVVHEAPRTCGFGAEVVALIQEHAFTSLQAPLARVTGLDTPFPYSLELEYLPLAPRIVRAIRSTVGYQP
jgi:pyruvate dehydrogenase E1 component beta subunit